MFLHLEFLILSAPSSIFVLLTQEITQKPYYQGYLSKYLDDTMQEVWIAPKITETKTSALLEALEASYFEMLPTLNHILHAFFQVI